MSNLLERSVADESIMKRIAGTMYLGGLETVRLS